MASLRFGVMSCLLLLGVSFGVASLGAPVAAQQARDIDLDGTPDLIVREDMLAS